MKDIQKIFDSEVAKKTKSKKFGLAVSGGVDSMCLLYLSMHSKAIRKKDIVVITVDHKIRGKESENDLKFVAEFCKKNGITCKAFTIDVPSLCAVSGRSVELEARIGRYGVFGRLCNDGTVDTVITAHHMGDNTETVVMNLCRGTGIDGLCGIKKERSGNIFRPLLDVSKDEIMEFANKNKIGFVYDSTNDDTAYTRNFIRKDVLEPLTKKYEKIGEHVLELTKDMQKVCEFLDSMLDISLITCSNGYIKLDIKALQNEVLAKRYIMSALKNAGIHSDISRVNLKDIYALKDARNGTSICIRGNNKAVKDYGYITFKTDEVKSLDFKERKYDINEKLDGNIKILKSGYNEFLKADKSDKNVLYYNHDNIPDTAVFRTRQDGDRFTAFGGKTKKLKDYLIDKKISGYKRDKIMLLCDGRDVLMIIGVEISKGLAVDSDSNIYQMVNLHE